MLRLDNRLATGQTIGANTTGTAANAIKWGGGEADFTNYGTTVNQFIGFDTDGKVKPYTFSQMRAALSLNNGSALDNTASNAIKLTGYDANFGAVTEVTPNYVLGETAGVLKKHSAESIRNFFAGLTLTNSITGNASNSTLWNNQPFKVQETGSFYYLMGFDLTDNSWKYATIPGIKNTLATSWQNVTNVDNKTTNTAFVTGSSRPSTPSGGTIALEYDGTSGAGNLFSYDYSTSTPKNTVLNSPGGNVGIGVNPTEKLEVSGNAKANSFISGKNASLFESNTSMLSAKPDGYGASFVEIGTAKEGINWYNGQALTFSTTIGPDITAAGKSERMRISANGNVGINNTTPLEKLSVNGKLALTIDDTTVGGKIYGFNDVSGGGYGGGLKFQTRSYNGSTYDYYDRLSILGNGGVVIANLAGTGNRALVATPNGTIQTGGTLGTVTNVQLSGGYGVIGTVFNPTTTPTIQYEADTASANGLASKARLANTVSSGTYLPTSSALGNTGTPNLPVHRYTKIGNVVTVYGSASISKSQQGQQTFFDLSLPIASNFSATSDATGYGVNTGAAYATVSAQANTFSKTITLLFGGIPGGGQTSDTNYNYSFSYTIK
jgi:hypothetical protein